MSFEKIELNNKYHLNNLFQYDSKNVEDKTTLVKVNNQLISVYKIDRIKISSALNKVWLSLIYKDIEDEKDIFYFSIKTIVNKILMILFNLALITLIKIKQNIHSTIL